ncbi:GMP synthase [glutamine-hydrolyzing] [Pseudovibrio axinellae]|uniref:GMP synthase [glutamine-hydrolyzing] n=1 Tax=Pseudovibrio axinellae TaxID=989403 RepID=A0A166B1F9_9HYPH|nr:glutamine amidotransferase [Pseudovibrio axinellae]KZL21811.1 GMP synthase [glutamine-hydrolyzing] [Pseudovibrio axinellae]SEQ79434.1 GMP synthase (glutamine-hydrolysing) [Pseudovibrio axinellae]
MKPFLILQLRPETDASDGEYLAILAKSGLKAHQTHRVRLDQLQKPPQIDLGQYSGVILGGGPGCVSDPHEKKSLIDQRCESAALALMPDVVRTDFPLLGCCYGIGILGHFLGGEVSKAKYGEKPAAVTCTLTQEGRSDPLLSTMPTSFKTYVCHKEALQDLPPNCIHLASSPACPFQIIRHGKNVYATQFHPELDSAGLEVRLNVYKDHSYFKPSEIKDLLASARREDVTAPAHMLRNFVVRYTQH